MSLALAAQFTKGSAARRAYYHVHAELSRTNPPLSVFRLWSAPHWYVVVVGDAEVGIFEGLVPCLREGTIVSIADETIDALLAKHGGID